MSTTLTSAADTAKLWSQHDEDRITRKPVTLEPLKEHHADSFFPSISGEANAQLEVYMPSGPFYELADSQLYIKRCAESEDVSF